MAENQPPTGLTAKPAFLEPKKEGKKLTTARLTLIAVAIIVLWFIGVQIIAADKYQAIVKVIEKGGETGINPTTEQLDFGDLPHNNSVSRFITLSINNQCWICFKNQKKVIRVFKFGSIAELMSINPSKFILSPNEVKQVEFKVYAPPSAPLKQYRGWIWIVKTPKLF